MNISKGVRTPSKDIEFTYEWVEFYGEGYPPNDEIKQKRHSEDVIFKAYSDDTFEVYSSGNMDRSRVKDCIEHAKSIGELPEHYSWRDKST
jgi:hypothetical protein